MSKVISAVTSTFGTNKNSPIGVGEQLLGLNKNNDASDAATNYQTSALQSAQNELQPYQQTGLQANTLLQNALSGGTLGGNFTPGDLTQDPGYQFALSQGNQALDRKEAAGGNYYSGQALKEAQTYGQGLADQTYNDAYNRWLQQQQNTYNILSGQQKQGQTAGTNIGQYDLGIGQANAQNTINKANLQNNFLSQF